MPSQTRLTTGLWTALLLAVAVRAAAPATEQIARLRERERELNTLLLEQKTQILRTDPEARRIQRQIESLYRDLEQILQSRPDIVKIQAQRDAVRKQLRQQADAPAEDNRQ